MQVTKAFKSAFLFGMGWWLHIICNSRTCWSLWDYWLCLLGVCSYGRALFPSDHLTAMLIWSCHWILSLCWCPLAFLHVFFRLLLMRILFLGHQLVQAQAFWFRMSIPLPSSQLIWIWWLALAQNFVISKLLSPKNLGASAEYNSGLPTHTRTRKERQPADRFPLPLSDYISKTFPL